MIKTVEKDGKLSLNELKQKAGLLSREVISKGRGRPKVLYYRKEVTNFDLEKPNVVILPFGRLKHICRFERGGRCKERAEKCCFKDCPIVQNKIEIK